MKTEKNMTLSLSALQYTPQNITLSDKPDLETILAAPKCGDGEKIKLSCSCRYISEGKTVKIEYSEKTPDSFCRNTVKYDGETGAVSISKNGDASTNFKIEAGKICRSEYLTGLGAFQVWIYGISVSSAFGGNGGVLTLDYISELRGLDAQRIKMRIEVKPCKTSEAL